MKTKNTVAIIAVGIGLAAIVTAILKSRISIPKGAIPVKPFDINRYVGRWYEIARFDFRFEKNLKNTTADYSFNPDGTIKVVNRGYNYKKKAWTEATGTAKFVDDPTEARLKVSFFGPFYAGYNVIAIDPDYKYALIAGENLDYLWLLSREKTMPLSVKTDFLKKASAIGYQTQKLVWVDHDNN